MERRLIGAMGDRDYVTALRGGPDAGLPGPTQARRRLRDTYNETVAMKVAMDFSLNRGTLKSMHENDEDNIPPPVIIRRWRREHPEFDDVMRECERALAEDLMQDTIPIADDAELNPQHAKNRIMARHKLAACYDRPRFGAGAGEEAEGESIAKSPRQMTRAQLQQVVEAAGLLRGPKAAGAGPAMIDSETGSVDE